MSGEKPLLGVLTLCLRGFSQDFLWDFETLSERVAWRKNLTLSKVEHTLQAPVNHHPFRVSTMQ